MRSLYFAVARAVACFDKLRFGLAAILVFAGAKLLLNDFVEIPTPISLAVIVIALAFAVAASHGRHQASA